MTIVGLYRTLNKFIYLFISTFIGTSGIQKFTLDSTASLCWIKHILLVNTKGSGVAKLRRKPSPTYMHTFTPLNTYTKK